MFCGDERPPARRCRRTDCVVCATRWCWCARFGPTANGRARLMLSASIPSMAEMLGQYLGGAALIIALSLVVAGVLAVVLQARVSAPILAIAEVAERISRTHQFQDRVQVTSSDELGVLARVLQHHVERDRTARCQAGTRDCRAPANQRGVALRQGARRRSRPPQERVPGQHEPRDPHADERRGRDDQPGAGPRVKIRRTASNCWWRRPPPSRWSRSSTTSWISPRSRPAR